jgi:hypothetical protein
MLAASSIPLLGSHHIGRCSFATSAFRRVRQLDDRLVSVPRHAERRIQHDVLLRVVQGPAQLGGRVRREAGRSVLEDAARQRWHREERKLGESSIFQLNSHTWAQTLSLIRLYS